MTREDRDSLVDIMSKIPIRESRGSLLTAIDRLLRVIDISESSIMIPTLLKDKCEFDAYEMLIMARILKASILGHNDLVEFYMSESSSSISSLSQQQSQLQSTQHQYKQQQSPQTTRLQSSQSQHQQQQHNQYHNSQLQLQSTTPSLASSSSTTDSTSSSPTPLQSSNDGIMNMSPSNITRTTTTTISSSSAANSNTSQQQLISNSHNGDPDVTVRLLLQIEHLKTFIPQVTGVFENIIELYKSSVDTYP